MRANLNDTELLKRIQSAASPNPLTAEEVAKLVGSMRHKGVPLLRGLAATGQIEIISAEGGNPPRFMVKQKPAGSAEQFTDNVVNHPTQLKRKDDKAPVTAKIEAQPTKAKVKKTASTSVQASIESKAPAATSKPAPAPVKAASPAPTASVSVPSDLPARDKILLILKQSPMKREDILRQFGAMGDVLQDMIKAGEVRSDFIINDHVFELTDKGNDAVEAIMAKAPVVAKEPVVAEAPVVTPVIEEPVAPAPVAKVAEPAAPVAAPAPEAPVVAPVPVAAAPAQTPAPAAKKAEEAPQAPAQPSPSAGLDNPIMKQVAELVEKLVSERLTELTEQLQERSHDRKKLVAAAAGIQKATAALQLGIDALNEVANIIAE